MPFRAMLLEWSVVPNLSLCTVLELSHVKSHSVVWPATSANPQVLYLDATGGIHM
jgi:hypothetical protein